MENSEVRTLLPVKKKDGRWVYPTEVVQAVEEEDEGDNEIMDEGSAAAENEDSCTDGENRDDDVVVYKSLVEQYASEQLKLKQVKTKIAVLCSSVTGDPENNMRSLKELLIMLQKPSTKMIVTEKKVLLLSLLRVFADVLPGYKVRAINEEQDKKVKLKKDTKLLLDYEMTLLRNYKKYLDNLQKIVNEMKCKRPKERVTIVQRKALREVGLVASRCLTELLVTRYYFNYSKTLVSIVVPLACNRNSEVQNICCKGIENLYKADKLGETSLECVKQTVKVIKERNFNVPSQFIRTFLCLSLKEVKVGEKEKTNMKKVRKELNAMSRKEKRHKKKMLELEQQLREAEAQENQQTKSKFQTEMLKKVFWVYFHVLKDDTKKSLITPVLEGLSNFAFLINIEFFDDLTSVLSVLLESGNLTCIEKLHCMQTVFTILAGQSQSLNIDPQQLYTHLYNIFLELENSTNSDEFNIVLKCIELMIIKRKKNITYNRMLAFTKRLCTMCMHMPLHFTITALLIVRQMILNTKNTDILLDTENSVGSGMYLPELEDPEYCNPASTALWELHLLVKSYNPIVRDLSQHIIRGCPVQGRMQLSDKLSKFAPEDILKQFSTIVIEHKVEPEQCKNPTKKLCVRKSTDTPKSVSGINCDVVWGDVEDLDFLR